MGTAHAHRTGLVLLSFVASTGCFSEPGRAPHSESNNLTTLTNNVPGSNDGGGCEPTDEVCDGEDNDCDGEVDEGFGVGDECHAGLGVCRATGIMVCNAAGDGVECDAVAGTPETEELCGDLLDNDCDGAIDEGFPDLGEACTSGLGVCETSGVRVCDGAATVCDAIVPAPPEVEEVSCDGLDNDCDGMIDEGCDDDGDGSCDATMTLVSPGGDALCPRGGGDCDDTDADVYPGAPGLCDGKDNDCDGGIDEIKRGRVRTFTVSGFAAGDLANSPVQAIASDTGFCFHITTGSVGARGNVRGMWNSIAGAATQRVTAPAGEHRVADIAWSGSRCGSLVVEEDGDATLDARAYWWSAGFAGDAAIGVVSDGITHIVPSWDATLTFARGMWVVGYSTTSGTAASYTTLRENFNSTDTPAAVRTVGLNGTFPELGDHPGGFDLLFASNFLNINVHQLNVGMNAAAVPGMQIVSSVSRSHLVMNTVNGETWFATRHAGAVRAWEIRRISPTPGYARTGSAAYTSVVEPQDFLSRNVFVGGPGGTVWFLDGVDEQFVVLQDTGAGLAFLEIADPLATGHVLAGRQASSDVTEVLWLTDPGTAARDAAFEVVEYRCY